jgi:hypothetical protein
VAVHADGGALISASADEEHEKRSGACGGSKGCKWIVGHPVRSPIPAIVEVGRGTLRGFTNAVCQLVGQFMELVVRSPEHSTGRLDNAVPGEVAGLAGGIGHDFAGVLEGLRKMGGVH